MDAWEIWNEEDSTAWWTGTPAQFAGLLRTAYAAIKSADANATVLLGGLTGNDVTYLDELYAAGARGSFDAVAVHTDTGCNVTSPYVFEFDRGTQTINQYFFLGFTAIHAAMVAAGDGAKPIYMTELGWSSTTAECETGAWAGQKLAGVDLPTQATYLAAGLPLSRPAAVRLRQGRDVVRTLRQRQLARHSTTTGCSATTYAPNPHSPRSSRIAQRRPADRAVRRPPG